MLISLRHIVLIISFTFSVQACAAEKQIHHDTQFIVQLTDTTIQKLQSGAQKVEVHRNKKLQQWGQQTGLALKAVPPTNQQRWIIKANTQDATHIINLINTVSDDIDVKYIERDSIMTIQPIQRPIPMLPPMTP
ncbi:hypothetical protein A9Q81_10820 [Gammaproteobacteria bacterium 42_54_T18]|nr:hypothetical protein A9Q81_10820 [Gammaproteobacteria bacterium 42_54_T18]